MPVTPAYVIAETARHCRDFAVIDMPDQLVADLALPTVHSSDPVAHRMRMTDRPREMLTGVFLALERAFHHSAYKSA
ncbi:hypothetical protein D3C57_143765, partial [Streptomyces rapamycinicus NRRL 5491]